MDRNNNTKPPAEDEDSGAQSTASTLEKASDAKCIDQLEQDIVAKQKGRSTAVVSSKPGAFSASNNTNTTVAAELTGLEADIRAKQVAKASHITKDVGQLEQDIVTKQKGRSTALAPSKPGAFSASNNTNTTAAAELTGLEADIRAKQVAKASHITKDVGQLEQDIVAKQKGRSTALAPSKPGAFVESNATGVAGLEASIREKQTAFSAQETKDIGQLEQDIVAKQKGRSSTLEPSKPGAFVESNIAGISGLEASIRAKQTACSAQETKDIGQLEQDIVAKQKGRSSTLKPSKPGVFVESNVAGIVGLEASIRAKQTASISQGTKDVGQLEQDIVAKQKGLNSSLEPSKPGVFVERNSAISTLTSGIVGVEADILAKQTGSNLRNTPETGNLDQVERDILAKQQGRSSTLVAVDDYLPADAEFKEIGKEIDELDQDLASKQEGRKNDEIMMNKNGELSGENKLSKKDEQQASGMQQGLFSGLNGMNDLEYGEYGGDDENGLAVACAVDEDVGDMYLPSAVEYDPDAKPPMYRNRRFRMYLCLAVTAVIVGTIGAVLGITMTNEDVPQEIPYRATLGIRENVARFVSNEQLDDQNSAYCKALDWIMYTDPMAITPDSPRFVQRYLLAYLYYATSVRKPWNFGCAPFIDEKDSCKGEWVDSIEPLRNGTNPSFRWLSAVDECSWAGIDCDVSMQLRGIVLCTCQ